MKRKLKEEIGARLRMLRDTLGMTQADMVKYFDVCRANYSRIEQGKVAPNPHIMRILKTNFNISLDWLVTGEGGMRPPKRKKPGRTMDFVKDSKELNDLIRLMRKIPMVKHAMLGYYLEYKYKNFELIRDLLRDLETNNNEGSKEAKGV